MKQREAIKFDQNITTELSKKQRPRTLNTLFNLVSNIYVFLMSEVTLDSHKNAATENKMAPKSSKFNKFPKIQAGSSVTHIFVLSLSLSEITLL